MAYINLSPLGRNYLASTELVLPRTTMSTRLRVQGVTFPRPITATVSTDGLAIGFDELVQYLVAKTLRDRYDAILFDPQNGYCGIGSSGARLSTNHRSLTMGIEGFIKQFHVIANMQYSNAHPNLALDLDAIVMTLYADARSAARARAAETWIRSIYPTARVSTELWRPPRSIQNELVIYYDRNFFTIPFPLIEITLPDFIETHC